MTTAYQVMLCNLLDLTLMTILQRVACCLDECLPTVIDDLKYMSVWSNIKLECCVLDVGIWVCRKQHTQINWPDIDPFAFFAFARSFSDLS